MRWFNILKKLAWYFCKAGCEIELAVHTFGLKKSRIWPQMEKPFGNDKRENVMLIEKKKNTLVTSSVSNKISNRKRLKLRWQSMSIRGILTEATC